MDATDDRDVAPTVTNLRLNEDYDQGSKQKSPTRVSDFDTPGDDGDQTTKDIAPVKIIGHPDLSRTPYQRRDERAFPKMPEATAGSGCASVGKGSQENHTGSRDNTEESSKPSEAPKSFHQIEVKKLLSLAAHLAARGKEKEAIKKYHRALKQTREDFMRIKRVLEVPSKQSLHYDESTRTILTNELVQLACTIADICTNEAVLYERMGDYMEAIKKCREARAVYHKHTTANENFRSSAEQMSKMLAQVKKAGDTFGERRRLHEKVIRIRKLISASENIALRQKLYREVFNALDAVLRLESEYLGETHPQVADTVGLLGILNLETNHVDVALKHFDAAVSILRLSLGPYHPKTGMGFKQLASLYDSRQQDSADTDKALHYYTEALVAFRESYGHHHALVGTTLNHIAVICIQQEKYHLAIEALSDALAAYESIVVENNSVHPNIAPIWKNLGLVYTERKEWESAILAYASSLEVQRASRRCQQAESTAGQEDSQKAFRGDQCLADTLTRLGKAMVAAGRHKEATKAYEEALSVYQANVVTIKKRHRDSQVHTEVLVAQEHVAKTMQKMGEVKEASGDFSEAMFLYVSSLMMRRQNRALREGHSSDGLECALSLAGIGSLHLRGAEFSEASQVLQEAMEICETNGLPNDHKLVVKLRKRLAEAEKGMSTSWQSITTESAAAEDPTEKKTDRTLVLDEQARSFMEQGDFNGAIRMLTQALVVRRKRLTKRQKKSSVAKDNKEKNDVARTLGEFGRVLMKKGSFDQAKVVFDEAVRMYRSNGLDEKDPCLKDILVELEQFSA